MDLECKQSMEALKHVLTNVPELRIKSKIWKTLIHNDCDFIEELINTAETDIKNLHNKKSTKAS